MSFVFIFSSLESSWLTSTHGTYSLVLTVKCTISCVRSRLVNWENLGRRGRHPVTPVGIIKLDGLVFHCGIKNGQKVLSFCYCARMGLMDRQREVSRSKQERVSAFMTSILHSDNITKQLNKIIKSVMDHFSSVCRGPIANFFKPERLLSIFCGAVWRINGEAWRPVVDWCWLTRGWDVDCDVVGLAGGGVSWLSSNGWRSITLTTSSSMYRSRSAMWASRWRSWWRCCISFCSSSWNSPTIANCSPKTTSTDWHYLFRSNIANNVNLQDIL